MNKAYNLHFSGHIHPHVQTAGHFYTALWKFYHVPLHLCLYDARWSSYSFSKQQCFNSTFIFLKVDRGVEVWQVMSEVTSFGLSKKLCSKPADDCTRAWPQCWSFHPSDPSGLENMASSTVTRAPALSTSNDPSHQSQAILEVPVSSLEENSEQTTQAVRTRERNLKTSANINRPEGPERMIQKGRLAKYKSNEHQGCSPERAKTSC